MGRCEIKYYFAKYNTFIKISDSLELLAFKRNQKSFVFK